jgi:hypothetical protein
MTSDEWEAVLARIYLIKGNLKIGPFKLIIQPSGETREGE